MDYFSVLDFSREPFSNSPEPEFFYQSPQHVECLQKLELAVRLRRGLNAVIGDVGAGKTTICRQIIRRFADDKNVETYLLLDPSFDRPVEFLRAIVEILGIADGNPDATEWHLKEKIKNHLLDKGVGEGKTLVLIIDEGQKIPDFCLEILREFLNYETNEHKLLQIIIFAQKEFYQVLETHPGFADRINFSYDLRPMHFADTRAMIRFRLDTARGEGDGKDVRFTFPALWAIYRATGGYPRKIVGLCHRIILALIIQDRLKAGHALVRFCCRTGETRGRPWKMALAAVALGGILITVIGVDFGRNLLLTGVPEKPAGSSAPRPVDRIATPMKVPPQQPPLAVHVKVSPPMVSSAEAATPGAEQCPESLGWLIVKRDGTICKAIRGVYGGECTPERIALIQKANPHIQDPDRIEPGAMLKLPAVPSDFRPAPESGCWVAVARRNNLEDAYGAYWGYCGQLPPIQVFPHWNGCEGLQFDVIMKKGFAEEGAARSAIAELPPSISSGARIIKGWEKDTVFFSTVAAGS
ncbi:MAG: AAA family ATPase [Deltaproteobacteria bacterium]|nr:AAA family ATPase [Deltaproteobacteria bacterium]